MHRTSLALLMALIAAIAIANCHGAKTIVGKWEDDQKQEKLEFTSDGKFNAIWHSGTSGTLQTVSGTYIVAGDQITITLSQPNDTLSGKYQFVDGDLVVTFVQGGMQKMDNTMAKY